MKKVGFEPTKVLPTDLQSATINHSVTSSYISYLIKSPIILPSNKQEKKANRKLKHILLMVNTEY